MRSRKVCSTIAAVSFTFLLSLSLVAQPAQAQTFQVLYSFAGSTDGGLPNAGVLAVAGGNLYGTGTTNGAFGGGVVFKVDSSGNETVLHSFGNGTADGTTPYSELIRDQAGNLYGTTYAGGNTACTGGCGTVFKIDSAGTESVLHSFAGGTTDGCSPWGGLVRDSVGNFYGTTEFCGAANLGTVFKIDSAGTETLLHSFAGGATDGEYPVYTSPLMDALGNLYGVTQQGGTTGGGVVYKLTQSGAEKVLYGFQGGTADGCYVLGTPFMDASGNIYGTASQCGASGVGTVWKLSKNGTETVLHNFVGGTTDGEYPFAGVIVDSLGNVYGCTKFGGASGFGTIYRIAKNGKEALIHSFDGTDGQYPYGNFAQNPKGSILLGTTQNGGTTGFGTVWKITK